MTPRVFLKRTVILAVQSGLGMALPVLAFVGYLVWQGALTPFLDAAIHYLPLYSRLTGELAVLPESERGQYLLAGLTRMSGRIHYLVMAFAGLGAAFAAFNTARHHRVIALYSVLLVTYVLYPAISGQFWNYHYWPMMYFSCITGAAAFATGRPLGSLGPRMAGVAAVLLVSTILFEPQNNFSPLFRHEHAVPKGGRVDMVAEYLRANLRPGDTVQPLDVAVGGMVQSMLYAEARIATPFVYYFHFFHHVDSPYIQGLRQRFVKELSEARPRFILEWTRGKAGWIKPGPYTSQRFPEVEQFIAAQYHTALRGTGFVIHERNEAPQ